MSHSGRATLASIREHADKKCLGGVCLKISERNWLCPACVETSAGRSAGGISPTPSARLALFTRRSFSEGGPTRPKLLSEGGNRSGKHAP
ncbi:MAG: hypothetical protein A3A28_03355 [Candidatus Sungbacteria bacterium RIFCSPLOWO2_01_FULL_47_32]|nr:MAG: hypothetical protein A3A28_03355 [Candidatus Sungbacteria bacterium RIFCSPLOWO2_01_FULL_47_32]